MVYAKQQHSPLSFPMDFFRKNRGEFRTFFQPVAIPRFLNQMILPSIIVYCYVVTTNENGE